MIEQIKSIISSVQIGSSIVKVIPYIIIAGIAAAYYMQGESHNKVLAALRGELLIATRDNERLGIEVDNAKVSMMTMQRRMAANDRIVAEAMQELGAIGKENQVIKLVMKKPELKSYLEGVVPIETQKELNK
jgi:hypothetical protein